MNARLQETGFDAAMLAALVGEGGLAADETLVNVLDKNVPLTPAPEKGKKRTRRRRTERPRPGRRTC